MSTTENHFADVLDTHVDGTDFGALGGDGATEAFSVHDNSLSQDGPVISFGCLSCGKGMQVIPSWLEVAIVSCRLAPRDDHTGQQWPLLDGKFVVPVRCAGCGKACKQAAFSPDLAQRFLQKGVAAGILTGEWVAHTRGAVVNQARMQGLIR